MRIGSKLSLGMYSVNKDAPPVPIMWYKATPNGDFITCEAIDYLCFDARERQFREDGTLFRNSGNPNYELSNIHWFLNSENNEWYVPKHENDNSPSVRYHDTDGYQGVFSDHAGFLRHFENYEISSLSQQTYQVNESKVTSLIRLPDEANIFGCDKFALFRNKGIRSHPSMDVITHKGLGMFTRREQFMPYFLLNKYHYHEGVIIIDRTGSESFIDACQSSGIRPV